MIRKSVLAVCSLVTALFAFTAITVAQDPTAVPGAEQTGIIYGVGDITGDTAPFYGQQVTIEGNVDELVNVRMFVLGEDAVLGASQVLVINNTGQEFPLTLTSGQKARVTGIVYAAFDQAGLEQFPFGMGTNTDMGVQTDMTAQPATTVGQTDMTMQPSTMGTTGFSADDMRSVLSGVIQERFGNFTIIELTSIDTLMIDPAQ